MSIPLPFSKTGITGVQLVTLCSKEDTSNTLTGSALQDARSGAILTHAGHLLTYPTKVLPYDHQLNNWSKPFQLYNYLVSDECVDDDALIVLVDSWDLVPTLTNTFEEDIVSAFENIGGDLVYSEYRSVSRCIYKWDHRKMAKLFSGRRYINSGCLVAKVKHFRMFLTPVTQIVRQFEPYLRRSTGKMKSFHRLCETVMASDMPGKRFIYSALKNGPSRRKISDERLYAFVLLNYVFPFKIRAAVNGVNNLCTTHKNGSGAHRRKFEESDYSDVTMQDGYLGSKFNHIVMEKGRGSRFMKHLYDIFVCRYRQLRPADYRIDATQTRS